MPIASGGDGREHRAHEALAAREPALGAVLRAHGPPPEWRRPTGFRTLARIVLEQQVSLASAATLFRRVDRELPGGLRPRPILRAGEAGLRDRGLTRQKAAYLVALAARTQDEPRWLARVARADDAEATRLLIEVKGIGPWSAAIYLLMALRRPDVWPPGDLALHIAMADLLALRERPDSATAVTIAERWRPHRALAARILWHHYLCHGPLRDRRSTTAR